MVKHFLFLSYKRSAATTPAVERLYKRIKVQLASRGVEPFFDRKSIEASESWEDGIDGFIAKSTLFVAFISIDFWLSAQCRRELDLAIARYEKEGLPKLLFVLADPLNPNDLAFDETQAREHVATDIPAEERDRLAADAAQRVGKLKGIGGFNFLGPYEPKSGALVRLEFEDLPKLDLQLAQLVESIKALKGVG